MICYLLPVFSGPMQYSLDALMAGKDRPSKPHKTLFMVTVEVFKTNVERSLEAQQLTALLLLHFPGARINFDLQDQDRILRVEARNCLPDKIERLVKESGFHCRVLE
ncbi:MAG: hypothetical protein ACXVMN_11295 [Flavisolibacter sp.]